MSLTESRTGMPAVHEPIAGRWAQSLLLLVILAAVVMLSYREAVTSMVGIWARSDTFAHGFLVPPISVWLAWRLRHRLRALQPRMWWPPLVALVPLGALWLLGELVSANTVTHFALVATLVLLVPLCLGRAVAHQLMFPLGFMFFCVPVGEFLMPMLMEGTADFAVAALEFSGIPVYREGLQFVIPSGNWSVVEACSGVRYLIASFMVGTLFAYLNYKTAWRRWVFVGVSLLMPILANWIRAYMIVMIGHLSGNTLAVGVDHLIYGWVFFGIVIMLMFWVGARWAEPDAQGLDTTPVPKTGPQRMTVGGDAASVGIKVPWMLAAAAALMVLWPQLVWQWINRVDAVATQPLLSWPAQLPAGWNVSDPGPMAFEPRYKGPMVEARRRYVGNGGAVGVHVAYYRNQSRQRKLVSDENLRLQGDADPWNQLAVTRTQVVAAGKPVDVRATTWGGTPSLGVSVDRGGLLVWQLMWVDGRWVADNRRAALFSAWSRLRGQGDDAAGVVFFTEHRAQDTTGADHKRLRAFVEEQLPHIEAMLLKTRQAR